MPHIQGRDRHSEVQFPPTLDDYIDAENPVRFIDAFVDQLDLAALGFVRVAAAVEGRPGYHPGDLLKLYLYGYLNRIRSSRGLERETHRNVELMWLLKQLRPDHKTIADFRKVHSDALRGVCRQFTQLCKELELFGGELVAIDGSKFLAVNSRRRNFTVDKLQKILKEVDEQIEGYLSELEQQDAAVPALEQSERLQRKLERLHERKAKHEALQAQMTELGQTQLSLTDADSRRMVDGPHASICYNVQTAVDAKHKLIVAHEVTNEVSDQLWLAAMALQAQEVMDVEEIEAVADRGYYDSQNVKQCVDAGITPYVSKPPTSKNGPLGRFTKEAFTYDGELDVYRCPAGERLTFRFEATQKGRMMRNYELPSRVCRNCELKMQCTDAARGRRIRRWEDESLLEEMRDRVKANPQRMKQRREIVEHPFGTLKCGMNQGYFLCRGLTKVRGEMSLSILSYNLKRVFNILGTEAMIAGLTVKKTVKE
ncbi:MAG: IS1182 family transposase [Myxacorys chilensis ATA2-1-KO14]|jgi:transposase|nr:IS1182 family transposase [Myxacorys chilensis ATA2-1-KO14]